MSAFGFTGGIGNVVLGADDKTGVGWSSDDCPVHEPAERPININVTAVKSLRTWNSGSMI